MKSKLIFEAWLKRVIKKGILTLGNNRSHFKGFPLNTLDIFWNFFYSVRGSDEIV